MTQHITWHDGAVTTTDRERILRQRGCVLWFTGLSGSGKSTLAVEVEKRLMIAGHLAYRLDGDNVRHGLNKDLGFSPEDRTENIRRIGEVSKLFADCGVIVLTSFISPYASDRHMARTVCGERFVEVFVDCPLDKCEQRDPKGLYKKARAGEIPEFTGISAPYEAPEHPELIVRTAEHTLEECAEQVIAAIRERGFVV